MSKNSGSMNAADFMAQLQADPEYRRKEAERQRLREAGATRVRTILAPLVKELTDAGFLIAEFSDLVPKYAPLPTRVIEILLRWLTLVEDDVVREVIVRALAASGEPIDGRPLVEVFEKSQSEAVRWAVANTLAEVRPLSVDNWLLKAASDVESGKAREMLAIAIARYTAPDQANTVLVRLLEEFPGHAAKGLAVSGTSAELPALENEYAQAKGWQRKEIQRAIKAIQKRTLR